ncbi:Adaptive-response sensory-kinase SasA [Synechococcus sp. CBW1107]|uniref:sensor histidine kinase n=1 Tax=Synechococcus sp. CBW1107 TaxID=2789857 RepID=UPI002AD5240C|nr:HAMP domain-containing sensor histidine kinase [Synechococcus sp. CBW1107]CAK6692303.1 Adaptive-response sensory-kinase SasA [Synechococcus sp. CBW1107]
MKAPDWSLRRWLQGSSLLAVLAGYVVLLLVNNALSRQARYDRHLEAFQRLEELLTPSWADGSLTAAQKSLDQIVSPGRVVWLEVSPGVAYRIPRANPAFPLSVPFQNLITSAQGAPSIGVFPFTSQGIRSFRVAGRDYLTSRSPVRVGDQRLQLRMLEDVTEDVSRRRTVQFLLVAAAGMSSLLTSFLLRLVFSRGLQPLDRLSTELDGFAVDQLDQERLSLHDQPLELGPIVRAFNKLLDRLSAGRQRQQDFVDGVAHELRTPITLISGYAQSLQGQGHALAGGPELELIAREAGRMGRMVSELLDIAREEDGRLQLGRDPIDLDEALLQAFERLEPLASNRLSLRFPQEGASPLGLGDGERLQQCLTNLVENALKYTPEGTPIELFSSTSASEAVLHVRDHGQGVPLAEEERIFERFVRGSSEASASGSGIGLAMVRLLMQRMGGEVRVESPPGGGADFQLVLERVQLSPSAPPA